MSNYAHPEVLVSSEWFAMECNSLRYSLAEDLADVGDRGPDEAELLALLDSVMPTLRSWAAPRATPLACARRAA